jgi:NIMA (never in mitosis gene a)-related kinase 1/4/5
MDQYEKLKMLGKGTYGKAWLVKDRISGQQYVLKEIKVNNQQEVDEALSEAEVLSKVDHLNITK